MPRVQKAQLRDRAWTRLSTALLDLAESLPPVKRGPLHWLQSVRREERLTSNACPSDLEFRLVCLWLCEIIPIETFERQIPRILKMIEEHRGAGLLLGLTRSKDLRATLSGFKDTVLGRAWYNFHALDCRATSLPVDYMSLEMTVFSGGHIGVFVRVEPNDEFLAKVSSLVRSEYPPFSVLHRPRNLRALVRGHWGHRTVPGESKKSNDLQRLIGSLSQSVRKYLQRYFSGLLFRPDYLLPSVELWIKKGGADQQNVDPQKPPFPMFWESVGLSRNSIGTYVAESGEYTITLPEGDGFDYALKIVCDEARIAPQSGFGGSITAQISHHVNYWVPTLLGVWSLRSLYRDFIDEMAADRLELFSRIKKLGARRTFRWARWLSLRESQVKRLEQDMSLEEFKRDFGFNVPVFTRTVSSRQSTLAADVVGNVRYLVGKYKNLLKATRELITATTEAHVIGTSRFTQLTNLALTIVILVLSVLMLVTGVLAISAKPKLCDAPRFAFACRWVNEFLTRK